MVVYNSITFGTKCALKQQYAHKLVVISDEYFGSFIKMSLCELGSTPEFLLSTCQMLWIRAAFSLGSPLSHASMGTIAWNLRGKSY